MILPLIVAQQMEKNNAPLEVMQVLFATLTSTETLGLLGLHLAA